MLLVGEPKCFKCGKPIDNDEISFCMDCAQEKRYFDKGIALWRNEGIVSECIYRFKFENQRNYGDMIGYLMVEALKEWIIKMNPQVLIPVPLYKTRRRERGYNQALLLANRIGSLLNIPVREYVLRIKKTTAQKHLGKIERRRNINKAFRVVDGMPKVKRVLIVDDIFTSGSTINELAKILKQEGVLHVCFLTISIGQER